jgi:hypothetical protein
MVPGPQRLSSAFQNRVLQGQEPKQGTLTASKADIDAKGLEKLNLGQIEDLIQRFSLDQIAQNVRRSLADGASVA